MERDHIKPTLIFTIIGTRRAFKVEKSHRSRSWKSHLGKSFIRGKAKLHVEKALLYYQVSQQALGAKAKSFEYYRDNFSMKDNIKIDNSPD